MALKYAEKCPKCKEPLHWEQMHGIRMIKNDFYSARCPKCRMDYKIKQKGRK